MVSVPARRSWCTPIFEDPLGLDVFRYFVFSFRFPTFISLDLFLPAPLPLLYLRQNRVPPTTWPGLALKTFEKFTATAEALKPVVSTSQPPASLVAPHYATGKQVLAWTLSNWTITTHCRQCHSCLVQLRPFLQPGSAHVANSHADGATLKAAQSAVTADSMNSFNGYASYNTGRFCPFLKLQSRETGCPVARRPR